MLRFLVHSDGSQAWDTETEDKKKNLEKKKDQEHKQCFTRKKRRKGTVSRKRKWNKRVTAHRVC